MMSFNSLTSLNFITGIKMSLVSPLTILKWSMRSIGTHLFFGCVSEPYTIDPQTGEPIINGLFCEKIFGPILSWQCKCRLFNLLDPIKDAYICPVCDHENNDSTLRRYRMGYIQLYSPLYHISYVENDILSSFVGVEQTNLVNLVYSDLSKVDTNNYSLTHLIFFLEYIQHKLSNINLVDKIIENRVISKEINDKTEYIKNNYFLSLFILNNIKPKWLLLTMLPILPAGLRPLLRLDDNNFTMSFINEVYRVIILRNNRVKRLKECRNSLTMSLEALEIRNLQKAVDVLLTNNQDIPEQPIFKVGSDFFKQYLLGKRVNFSGRSVITSGPTLTWPHVGLPFKMGIKLFEYSLLRILSKNKLIRDLISLSVELKKSKLIIKRLLNLIIQDEVIIINRAPTLHRMNVQSFKPHLVEGRSIKLFPLACSGFNADFDGDQMGVFSLTSRSSILEAKHTLINYKNMIHPSAFKNLFKYTQTIVLGLNTMLGFRYKEQVQFIFNSINEVLNSYAHNIINLNSLIILKLNIFDSLISKIVKKYIFTSVGKLLLYNVLY